MRSLRILVTTLIFFVLIIPNSFSAGKDYTDSGQKINRDKLIKYGLAGAENPVNVVPIKTETLGFDEIVSNSPGLQVGLTTFDEQSVSRNNRQVDWRASQGVHFTWNMQLDSTLGGDRGSGYEYFNYITGQFVFEGAAGGCDVHPRLGIDANYSGYPGLDVDTESKVVIGNHHEEGGGYAPTMWYDFSSGACFFSPYKTRVPDSTMAYNCMPDYQRFLWPSAEYQVFAGDTVTHLFAYQYTPDIEPAVIRYFRRVGSDTLGNWEYPPMDVDTTMVISQTVTSSRQSGKVALVWQAPPGATPGAPESETRDLQRFNDVYYMMSDDMGASWGGKVNVTGFDSSAGGWLGSGDMSCLIDTDEYLHIIWPARLVQPNGYDLGDIVNFYGSRLLHWDDLTNTVTTVKDANWDLPEGACNGGAWNEMSIVKPMISECNGNLYAFYTQFNDVTAGIYDDCAAGHGDTYSNDGTANGEIYLSISVNGGFNWSSSYNLTNTYTPNCYPDDNAGTPVCESDMWVSASRYGMEVTDGNFDIVPVVDPTESYSGNSYIDVMYVNDKFPGSVLQNDGIWTMNPMKWFRVPCFEPVLQPCISVYPLNIGYNDPAWTYHGVQKDTVLTISNYCNDPLIISSITPVVSEYEGWLGASSSGPITVQPGESYELTVYLNNGGIINDPGVPHVVEGNIQMATNIPGEPVVDYPIKLIVWDGIIDNFPVDIRTECLRLRFYSDATLGDELYGGYNMDYTAFGTDCDTTDNIPGNDDNASVYLYEASPFIMRINSMGDTVLYSGMYNSYWFDGTGFFPNSEALVDSVTYPDYQYGLIGSYMTPDSTLGLTTELFAPKDADSCNFIVIRQRVYNLTNHAISNVFVGDITDWDIPSDSGMANLSDFDDTLNLMYMTGMEYSADQIANNDCVEADQRAGGYAFYRGYSCRINNPGYFDDVQAQWTENNRDWVWPSGNFKPGQLYQKASSTLGYEVWEATGDLSNPDSMATDLHHVAVVGQFDFYSIDTLEYIKILATEYDGGPEGLKQTIAKARQWIDSRPDMLHEYNCQACNLPGDVNNDGHVNINDITYYICYLYAIGICPDPIEFPNQADVNGDCKINILDITYMIMYLYRGGPAPVCGCIEY